jgi:uncharacterized protein involved in outer membrane biogenesis
MAGISGLKALAYGGAGFVVAAGIGLVAAPALVDLNSYKPQMVAALSKAVGRPVAVDGEVGFTLLPLPAVEVHGVRLANRADGSEPDMVRIEQVEVRLSLGSLLSGTLRAESVALERPRILLEQTPSGANWDFSAPASPLIGQDEDLEQQPLSTSDTTSSPVELRADESPQEAEGAFPFDLAIDDIEIHDGLVVYREGGHDYRLSDLSVTAQAHSLRGPFKGTAALRYQAPGQMTGPGVGVPLALEASLGAIRDGMSVPTSVHFMVLDGAEAPLADLSFSGLLAGSSVGRTLRGDLIATANDGRALGEALGIPVATGPLSFRTALVAGSTRLALEGIQAEMGGTRAQGTLSWDGSGEAGRVGGQLTVSSLDLDRWLSAAPAVRTAKTQAVEPSTTVPAAEPKAGSSEPTTDQASEQTAQSLVAATGQPHLLIPTNLRGDIDLRVEAVTWKGRALRQGHVAISFDNQGVTIQEATVLLPGSASVTAAGRLLPAPVEQGGMAFDLALEAQSDNLRSLLAWQEVALDGINPGRLNRAQISASIAGSLAEISIPDLEAVIDTTALRGAATLRLPQGAGERLGLGVTVEAAKIDLDAYRPVAGAAAAPKAVPQDSPQQEAPAKPDDAQTTLSLPEKTRPTTATPWWTLLDANVNLAVQTLIWNDVPLRGAALRGSLIDGRLLIEDLHVDDLAGGALAARGAVIPHANGWAQAGLEGLNISLSSPNPSRTARALGVGGLEGWPEGTPLALDLAASGPLVSPREPLTLSLSGRAVDGEIRWQGQVQQALALPQLDGSVTVQVPDAVRLVRLLNPTYRPTSALGPLSGRADVSANLGGVTVSGLSVTVGSEKIEGEGAVKIGLTRPTVNATLRIGSLNLDRYKPLARSAQVLGTQLAAVGAGDLLEQLAAASVNPRWSTSAFDLSGLQTVNADLDLTADRLQISGLDLRGVKTTVRLKEGDLAVTPLSGTLYGGALTGSAALATSKGGPRAAVTLSVKGAQAGRLLGALQGVSGDLASVAGTATFDLDLSAEGKNQAEMVQTLSGQGNFDFSGLNLTNQAGQILILKPLLALNQFAAVGGLGQQSAARIEGGYSVQNGITHLRSVAVSSALYNGSLQGVVNLPLWSLDVEGQVRLSENLVAGLLRKKLKLPEVVPVRLSGDMDRPLVRVLGGQPLGPSDGASAPKVEQVVPALLDKYIGEGGKETTSQENPPVKPEKAARDLLRGLLGQ